MTAGQKWWLLVGLAMAFIGNLTVLLAFGVQVGNVLALVVVAGAAVFIATTPPAR